MRLRQSIHLATAGVAVLLLAGCASSAYPAFEREATEQDAVPDDFALFESAEEEYKLDLDTFRHEASHESAEIYLVKSTDENVCLVVAAGEESFMSCGSQGGEITAGSPAGTFGMGPAPIQERDGWTVLSENVRVQD